MTQRTILPHTITHTFKANENHFVLQNAHIAFPLILRERPYISSPSTWLFRPNAPSYLIETSAQNWWLPVCNQPSPDIYSPKENGPINRIVGSILRHIPSLFCSFVDPMQMWITSLPKHSYIAYVTITNVDLSLFHSIIFVHINIQFDCCRFCCLLFHQL